MRHKVTDVVYRRFNKHLTLTLIQPASKWMHWTTLWRHSDLFWAATCASSQVIPKSLLTVYYCFYFICIPMLRKYYLTWLALSC